MTIESQFGRRWLAAAALFYLLVSAGSPGRAQETPSGEVYSISGESSGWEREYFSDEELPVVSRYLNSGRRGEVYAWTCLSGGLTAWPYKCEIRRLGEHAELRIDRGPKGYDWRRLEDSELTELEGFITSNEVDRWPARVASISDAPHFQFLHLAANSGHRFSANVSNNLEPDRGKPLDKYEEFFVLFQKLLKRKPTRTVYALFSYLRGARVLWDGESAVLIVRDGQHLLTGIRQPDGSYQWRSIKDDEVVEQANPPKIAMLQEDPMTQGWTLPLNGQKLLATDQGLFVKRGGETREIAKAPFEHPVLAPPYMP